MVVLRKEKGMKTIGNILWFLFGGWVTALIWLIGGILFCLTIVGIPFGIQCFKFARLSLFPYGKKVAVAPAEHPIANIVWAVFFGWEMAIAYLVCGVICCVTIIGIPNGIVAFKLTKLALLPFGAKVVKK